MNREFKKGIKDKTKARADESLVSIRKNREAKRFENARSRMEIRRVKAFDDLRKLWNPASLMQGDVVQLDVLKTMVLQATEDEMEQWLPIIIPVEHTGKLVDWMRSTQDPAVINLLAECIAGITFHITTHDKHYAAAFFMAGYPDVALYHLNRNVPCRANLWRPLINFASSSSAAAVDVMRCDLFKTFPQELQRFDIAVAYVILNIITIIQEAVTRKPQDFLLAVWDSLLLICPMMHPVDSWETDLDPLTRDVFGRTIWALDHVFLKLNDAVPNASWIDALLRYANVRDAPGALCYKTLANLALYQPSFDLLFERGIVQCVMNGLHVRDASPSAFNLLGNLFSIGPNVVETFVFTQNVIVFILQAMGGNAPAQTRRMATYALNRLVAQTRNDLILRKVFVEEQAFKYLSLEATVGAQTLIDGMEIISFALLWNREHALVALEDHGLDSVIQQYAYSSNADVAKLADRLSNVIHHMECKETEYVEAANHLPFSF